MSGPRQVLIIRHAEKPADDDDVHLSAEGRHRADLLVNLFGLHGRFEPVQYLIAADRSKHSNRCVETLRPLSYDIGLSLNHEFEDDEYGQLAVRLRTGKKYQGAVVLICWHHGNIPALARALKVRKADLPCRAWPDEDFDSVWILDWTAVGLVIRSEPHGLVL